VDFDLAIVGGGPVGLFLGLAARDAGLRPVVLEARAPEATQADDRSLALSWASCLRLERVGAKLPDIGAGGAIRSIHVSHAGHAGRSWITADDAGIPMLGRVLGYGELVLALSNAARGTIDVRYAHAVSALAPDDDGVVVATTAGEVRARVAIVADGSGALLADAGWPG
jgi:2-polyprenyl-6-methoxyphenol hydroxylase-like FAD-dependent oxidoreductase